MTKRLRRLGSEVGEAKKILDRIDKSSEDLRNNYYVLFDNLNALYESYPDLYKKIEMTVKLPKNEDAHGVVKFYKDLHDILEYFSDNDYLSEYVDPEGIDDVSKIDSE